MGKDQVRHYAHDSLNNKIKYSEFVYLKEKWREVGVCKKAPSRRYIVKVFISSVVPFQRLGLKLSLGDGCERAPSVAPFIFRLGAANTKRLLQQNTTGVFFIRAQFRNGFPTPLCFADGEGMPSFSKPAFFESEEGKREFAEWKETDPTNEKGG